MLPSWFVQDSKRSGTSLQSFRVFLSVLKIDLFSRWTLEISPQTGVFGRGFQEILLTWTLDESTLSHHVALLVCPIQQKIGHISSVFPRASFSSQGCLVLSLDP